MQNIEEVPMIEYLAKHNREVDSVVQARVTASHYNIGTHLFQFSCQ